MGLFTVNESTKSRIRSRVVEGGSITASEFQSWPNVGQVPWLLPWVFVSFLIYPSSLAFWTWLFVFVFKITTFGIINREISAAKKLRKQEEEKAAAEALKIKKKAEEEKQVRKNLVLSYIDTAFNLAITKYEQQFDKTIKFPSITWLPNYWKQEDVYQQFPHIEDFPLLKKNAFSRGINVTASITQFNKYREPSIALPSVKRTIQPYYFSGDLEKRSTEKSNRHRGYRSRNSIFLNIFLDIMEKESRDIGEIDDRDWNKAIENINAKLSEKESFYHKKYTEFSDKNAREIEIFNRKSRKIWEENNLKFISDSQEPKDHSLKNVQFFCSRLFQNLLNLPIWMPLNFSIFWEQKSQILIIEAEMPDLTGDICKFRPLKNGNKVVSATKKEAENFREGILFYYPILLAYLVAKNNITEWAKFICVNGFVNFTDPATGNPATANILSLAVNPEDIVEIDIENIEPAACFKRFKGLSASKVADLIPVEPIIRFNKEEGRFIDGKDVANSVSGTNLALMDWQDFEYLVRQIFEEEFQSAGAEVRVTQSSRDKGVDAIIFDPDPIKGGKIVVQAKRYSHTVDVSAVRDLYGTVMNEGANTGIIITTSNYGKDSYDFAKDKPLKLLNGANLLHLLEKHGHKAHIDLNEAKKILAEPR